MDTQSIIADIDNGIRRGDVTVFRFRKGRAVLNTLLFTLTGAGLTGAAVALAAHMTPAAGAIKHGLVAVAGLLALSAFWQAWRKGTEVRDADTNVLVVTPEGVLRRLRGQVQSWPFAQYSDISFVIRDLQRNGPAHTRRIELGAHQIEDDIVRADFFGGNVMSIHLNEAGAGFQHELVDDGSFGSMHHILRALATHGTGQAASRRTSGRYPG
jgi:hypothetical protein